MFPVIVNDGTVDFPDDDIYYIVCKEGVYLKKRLGVMESIAPVKNISILNSVETMARMHIRKIPAKNALQIINFFKAVYKEYYGEAIVLLFYNQETKKHKTVVPVQEVSGGAADYNKAITIPGWDMIGTIHSHAGMSAFHSGVDDDDEKSFDGLHITFGNMKDEDISVSASIVANGYRVMVNPSEYVNNMVLTVNVDEEEKIPYAQTWKWDPKQHKMVKLKTGKYYTRRKFDQRYRVQMAKDPKFPAEWMEKVSKKTYTYQSGFGGKWTDGWYGNGHNPHYDANAWKGWQGHGVKDTTTGKSKTLTPSQYVKKYGNNPPPAIGAAGGVLPAKPKTSPCDDCSFKNHKVNMMLEHMDDEVKKAVLAWAIDQLEGNNYKVSANEVNETGLSHYQCMGCNELFSVDETQEGEACCPNCKTDEYLVEILESEIVMGAGGIEPESVTAGMKYCDACGSSFTEDFLNDGKCPTCGNLIVTEKAFTEYHSDTVENHIPCPDCGHQNSIDALQLDNRCTFCPYEFDIFEIQNVALANTAEAMVSGEHQMEEQLAKDAGKYLDPDQEAIQQMALADNDVERIPVPDQQKTPIKKPGIFASLFNKVKK
jgi:hypothetical protein